MSTEVVDGFDLDQQQADRRAPGGAPARTDAVTIGVINDYEVIVRGVAAMLEPYRERVVVVEIDAGGVPSVPMDVALFDTFAGRRHTLERAREMVQQPNCSHVVLYTWDATPPFVRAAEEIGVSGIILKSRPAEALVEGLERVAAGERVGLEDHEASSATRRRADLSERESEVLALLARGLTNGQIAAELFLSVETVKTYVKRIYAKLDVHNRAQAAVAAAAFQLAPRP